MRYNFEVANIRYYSTKKVILLVIHYLEIDILQEERNPEAHENLARSAQLQHWNFVALSQACLQ